VHPIQVKLQKLQYERERTVQKDPLIQKFKNFTVENEIPEKFAKVRKPKISEWNSQDVMLPILGKNKTSFLHSKEQFEFESIVNHKKYFNKPRNMETIQAMKRNENQFKEFSPPKPARAVKMKPEDGPKKLKDTLRE